MKTELQELIKNYLQADADLEAQQVRVVNLSHAKRKLSEGLAVAFRESIEVNEEFYLDCGNSQILYVSDDEGELTIQRIETTSIDELAESDPE